MKICLMTICILFSCQIFGASAVVKVEGMVCQACVSTLTKKFKGLSAVQKVKVVLKSETVALDFHEKKNLTDKEIEKLITKEGYKVSSIKRAP